MYTHHIVWTYSCSVTKQEQQHIYDYITTNSLTARASSYERPAVVKKPALIKNIDDDDDDIAMDINPAYGKGAVFANKSVKSDEDTEYVVTESPFKQNPAHAETEFK